MDKHPNVKFFKIDTMHEPLEPLCAELGVKTLPAFKFFKVSSPRAPPPLKIVLCNQISFMIECIVVVSIDLRLLVFVPTYGHFCFDRVERRSTSLL